MEWAYRENIARTVGMSLLLIRILTVQCFSRSQTSKIARVKHDVLRVTLTSWLVDLKLNIVDHLDGGLSVKSGTAVKTQDRQVISTCDSFIDTKNMKPTT